MSLGTRISAQDAHNTSLTSSVTATFPSPTTATTHTLVAVVFANVGIGFTTMAGWTLQRDYQNGARNISVQVFAKIASGETTAVAVATGATIMRIQAFEYPGLLGTFPVDRSNAFRDGLSADHIASLPITTTDPADLVLVIAAMSSSDGGTTSFDHATVLQANQTPGMIVGEYRPGVALDGFIDTAHWATSRIPISLIVALGDPQPIPATGGGGLCNTYTSDILGPSLTTSPDGTTDYAFMYTVAGEILACKRPRSGSTWEVEMITGAARAALGIPGVTDGHEYPCIAVDGQGYIHGWPNNFSVDLSYVVSDDPEDISAFTAATVPDQQPHNTYPAACRFADGTVFFMVGSCGPPTIGTGHSNASYWTLGPTDWPSPGWSSRVELFKGTALPGGEPDIGIDDETNYNAYCTMPVVDRLTNRLWIGWIWEQWGESAHPAPTYLNERECYMPSVAYNDNNGDPADWHAPDGTPLTLPITPLNNLACQTGLVHPATGYANTGYYHWGGITVDHLGRPHMAVSTNPYWHMFEDEDGVWQQEEIPAVLDGYTLVTRVNCYWLRGKLWVLGCHGTLGKRYLRLFPIDGGPSIKLSGQLPLWEPIANHEAYQQFGLVETLVPDRDLPRHFSFGGGARGVSG